MHNHKSTIIGEGDHAPKQSVVASVYDKELVSSSNNNNNNK